METAPKKALITGITGQDGSYLAEFLLSKNYEVHGIVRRGSTFNRVRLEHLLEDVRTPGIKLILHYGDLSDSGNIFKLIHQIKPDEVYHLGAMSHVRVSFDMPEYTADVDALGTLRILEAIKSSGLPIKFYNAASSEMFGYSVPPQNEKTLFHPRSPYAVSKVFSYYITQNYREAYNIFACNGILFNHECLTAQTPIIIKRNNLIDIVSVEEIVPHREDPSHGIRHTTISGNGLEVWDGENWTKIKTTTATWNRGGSSSDKKVQRVICRGGYYEATYDHISFLKGKKHIKTGELMAGNELELKQLPDLTNGIITTLEEAEFLGMMAADGYVSPSGRGRFINDNKKLRVRIAKLWKQICGGYSREDRHPSGFYDGQVASVEFSGNVNYLKMIRNEIYNEKKFKKVPKRILNSSSEIIRAFLRGYNYCDGLKGGHQKTEFKSFTTNSPVLALGLWYLVDKVLRLRLTLHPEFRDDKLYFHLNINSNNKTQKGKHLQRPISEVKSIKKYDYTGWLFDLETESGTFSAGVGLTWIHNSPRRGESFVTRKITNAISRIKAGLDKKIYLGNLEAKRDWGFAPEYCEAMWLMLQQQTPDDFVVATGEAHSVKEFLSEAFIYAGLGDWQKYVEIDPRYFRPAEVDVLMGDSAKARENLGWEPKVKFGDLVKIMLDADLRKTYITVAVSAVFLGEGDKILQQKFPNRWWKVD